MQLALKRHLVAGTTATIALLMDNELLVANLGDSKAFLCSEKLQNCEGTDYGGYRSFSCFCVWHAASLDSLDLFKLYLILIGSSLTSLDVIELTKDHHPDRDDEKARILSAGGFVTLSGVPRVNGILAMS